MRACNYDAILVLRHVSRCFSRMMTFFGQWNRMRWQLQRHKKKMGNAQSPCKESVWIYAPDWTYFSWYAYVSHLLPPLTLKFALDKVSPTSPARDTLTAIWFYCHSLLGAVTVCNLWLNLLMSSSQSFSLIKVCCVDVGSHANRCGKDDKHLKVLCTLRSKTQREVWLLCALFHFFK